MTNNRIVLISTVFVAVVMVLSSVAILTQAVSTDNNSTAGTANTQAVTSTQISKQVTELSNKATNILQTLHSKGIPNKYIYIPNFNKGDFSANNTTGPSYSSAPAPMGIGTYGFSNNSGVISRYQLNTSSFEGSVTFNNLSTFYPYDDGPNSITVQLNSILNNVTLFGKTNYTFWNQNVLFYSARLNEVQFLDNIWNFSSPAFNMTPNVFSSYGGNLISPVFYYAVGPAFSVTYPFTVNFYLNSTVLNGENTVFFNFTIKDSMGVASGSFDEVQFNSVAGMPAGYSAPQANYLVTSTNVTPTGFIPYDSEIMIGGPGGGSTAMVNNINASMNLKYMNSTTQLYTNVPSAYDVGSETGETSMGVAVTWTPNAVAHLSAGPSFVYGMWNVSQTSGTSHYTGTVNPPDSFMFVSQGPSFNASNATWSPISQNGHYSFWLPSGAYTSSVLMSNRDPQTFSLTPGTSQNTILSMDMSMGLYTPLYAFGNQQLQYISSSGSGTSNNPYVLFNNPSTSGMLSNLFSSFNDYIFPDFAGVLLHSTTSYVTIENMPAMFVQYTQTLQLKDLAYFHVNYTTNQLGYVLYNAQHVTMRSNDFSGWFASTLTEFPVANVLLWNSQYNNIISNNFVTMDSSLMIYNVQGQGGYNLVFHNDFYQADLNNTTYPYIAVSTTLGTSPYGPVAITVYSSYNTITSNYVLVYLTAISPNYSIYSGLRALYKNNWNSNFWWSYAAPGHTSHGTFYNDFGLISHGGDQNPIVIPGYSPSALLPYVTNFLYS